MNPPGCENPDIGKMLSHYELGLLGPEDRERFEEHLLKCDACAEELESMYSVATALRANRESVRDGLAKSGITTDALRRQLAAEKAPSREAGWWGRFRTQTRGPGVAWVAGTTAGLVVVALAIYLVLIPTPQTTARYVPLLSFQALPFEGSMTLRGAEKPAGQDEFDAGMQSYQRGDFKSAVRHLKPAVEQSADQPKWWLYLGISYYMIRKPVPAIDALGRAEQLGQGSVRLQARWFMAQAYLLKGDRGSAEPLLQSLAAEHRDYAAEATGLLGQLRQQQ